METVHVVGCPFPTVRVLGRFDKDNGFIQTVYNVRLFGGYQIVGSHNGGIRTGNFPAVHVIAELEDDLLLADVRRGIGVNQRQVFATDAFQVLQIGGRGDNEGNLFAVFVGGAEYLQRGTVGFVRQQVEVFHHLVIPHQRCPYREAEEGFGRGNVRVELSLPLEIILVLRRCLCKGCKKYE
ncbi:hypothetical protein Barb7_00917 [Bacteroidales bacterium Barb7]|nr:hypothetical protein Barb7_00917 [Bacteroidales bacterium Barb7]